MSDALTDALNLASLLAAAEAAAPSDELTALHDALWTAVQSYAGALGLSYDDLVEIGAVVGTANRGGGTPKTPEPGGS